MGIWWEESFATMYAWEMAKESQGQCVYFVSEKKFWSLECELPAVPSPAPPCLQHSPVPCGSYWRKLHRIKERQHSGAPDTAVPPLGHEYHRLGSPQGVLLKIEQGNGMLRHGTGMRAWGYHRLGWLPRALQRLRTVLSRALTYPPFLLH